MLIWSDRFETRIEIVDTQHKHLFEMLNKLADSFNVGELSESMVEEALNELVTYAHQHFIDEEMVMLRHHVDARHVNLHRMEHKSFIYDVDRMRTNVAPDEDLAERAEKLLRFVTSWLVYHTLRTDQVMAWQVAAIKHGMSPAQAYEANHEAKHDDATNKMVLDAVLHLWRESTERCRELEERLEAVAGA